MKTYLGLESAMHELDTAEKICLAKNRDAIVADVEAKFVLPHIEESGIFTKEECEDILRQVQKIASCSLSHFSISSTSATGKTCFVELCGFTIIF
uniref:Apoptotic protease activating factor n=1 Tax=Rhipicephalus zambeziensis TaxID=60191 RepID=A0A224YHS6_9ACAR